MAWPLLNIFWHCIRNNINNSLNLNYAEIQEMILLVITPITFLAPLFVTNNLSKIRKQNMVK